MKHLAAKGNNIFSHACWKNNRNISTHLHLHLTKLFYSKIRYCTKRFKQCRTVKSAGLQNDRTGSDEKHAAFFKFCFSFTKIERTIPWRRTFQNISWLLQ